MLYRGSLGRRCPWHVEDSMLPSVPYCQSGKPKVWWVVPAHQRTLVEALLLEYIPPFVLTAADGNIWDVLASNRLLFHRHLSWRTVFRSHEPSSMQATSW